ncbi:MAG: OsmC family protein [Thermoanaerobaculia bacterium]|jgi:osmotically inducible protein OsmC|nr:MAG: OsmC family protein [Thermoanaerobaculia bacterium]MBZ0101744.1 OsmC family protein [Thermoanaerobaculia bacterium]
MATRNGSAVWNGGLKDGNGTVRLGSGAFEGAYSFSSRFEEGTGTNPEELIAAAHAGCFSMALSGALQKAGFAPRRIATTAKVHLRMGEGGASIALIELDCEAEVPGIDAATFAGQAEGAKKNCPVSKALAAVEIRLAARLAGV